MAHLRYSDRDQGFYLNTRRDLDLGWTLLGANKNIISKYHPSDLTGYERILIQHRQNHPKLRIRKRLHVRKRLQPHK